MALPLLHIHRACACAKPSRRLVCLVVQQLVQQETSFKASPAEQKQHMVLAENHNAPGVGYDSVALGTSSHKPQHHIPAAAPAHVGHNPLLSRHPRPASTGRCCSICLSCCCCCCAGAAGTLAAWPTAAAAAAMPAAYKASRHGAGTAAAAYTAGRVGSACQASSRQSFAGCCQADALTWGLQDLQPYTEGCSW